MILTPDEQDNLRYHPIDGEPDEDGRTVLDVSFDHRSRWSTCFAVTFTDATGQMWQFLYEEPSIQMQDIDLDDIEAYPAKAEPSTRYVKA